MPFPDTLGPSYTWTVTSALPATPPAASRRLHEATALILPYNAWLSCEPRYHPALRAKAIYARSIMM